MMKMSYVRKIMVIAVSLCFVFSLAACGKSGADNGTEGNGQTGTEPIASAQENKSTDNETQNESSEPQNSALENPSKETVGETEETPAAHSDVLVVVFSATGTTKGVAEKIAAIEGADIYEILAAEPYSDADLNWNDSNSRTTKEQNDKSVRPEIGSETIDLSGYSKIYVGYPIWWGEAPRIMDTFVESYDFGNATMIPFCTSSSSGIGRSGKNLADNAGSGNWLDGARFSGSVSEDELRSWIEGLN